MQHFHNMFLKYPCSTLNSMKIKETSQKRGVIMIELFGPVSDDLVCKLDNLNCHKLTKSKCPYYLRREIGCVLIIQQKFQKFEFFPLCTVEKFKFSEFLLDDKNATFS